MEQNNQIKNAFQKVKQDILTINSQLNLLTQEIQEFKRTLSQTQNPTDNQTDRQTTQTQNQTNPTDNISAKDKTSFYPPESKNFHISTGNGGVQTDRQTDRQSDRQTQKFALNEFSQDPLTKIEEVAETLNSLDSLKKEIRAQFKKLTSQEMLVFSTIYHLEEMGFSVDYSLLSKKINLSESSIRDYIQNLIKKGVPLKKTKENNKKITLSILPDLRKIASLDTILKLREI